MMVLVDSPSQNECDGLRTARKTLHLSQEENNMANKELKKKQTDKVSKILSWVRWIAVIFLSLYAIGAGISKGMSPHSDFWLWSGLGLVTGLFVIGIFVTTELGLSIWQKSMDWTIEQLRRNLRIRRWVIAIFTVIFTLVIFYITIFNWNWDNLLRIPIFIFLGLILPATLISFAQDDAQREKRRLANQIPSELIIQKPQAAVEHAFTIFEDHLRQRLGVGSDFFSERLINHAFAKNGKLVSSEIEAENEGVRNLIAGAYATFRNPRKHRIIRDDEQTAFAIVSLIELLLNIVDESKDRA